VNSNAVLGRFITFILLLALPKNRAVAGSNLIHTQPAAADLLPLTRLLSATLDRVRAHEQLQVADNLVQNGGFETGNFTGWTLTGDVLGAQVATDDPHTGCCYGKFNPIGDFVYLSQDIPTTEGLFYDWNWRLKSHDFPPTEFEVFWNGQMIGDFKDLPAHDWEQLTFNDLLATGSVTEIKFGFNGFRTTRPILAWMTFPWRASAGPRTRKLAASGTGLVSLAGTARRCLSGRTTNRTKS
jgi:hypothetical protein